MSIFVGNLPFRAEREDVLQLFAPFGEVMNCSLPLERDTGRKRGFAFVEMADEALETAAIEALQGTEMMGRPLRINKAEPRSNTPRRNNNYGSSRGGGYGGSNNGGYSGGGYGGSNNGGYSGGGYGGSNNGYNEQNVNFNSRPSGAKDWEDRSYGNNVENSEYESGRSRRRRSTGSDNDSANKDMDIDAN